MKVCWTNTATEHLSAIQDYIAEESPFFARRMVERLINRSEQIGEFPHSGREVPEYDADDIREVIEGPYRIIYRIKPVQIDVLVVIHGAQLLPENL